MRRGFVETLPRSSGSLSMINLIHVRSFLAVVDNNGVRSAAKELDVAPSTIVEHLKQLEQDVAASLLVRERATARPTPQGLRFLPYARALIGTAKRARELIHQPLLRLAAASNVGIYLLQPPLAVFQRQTGIDVEIWIGPNPQVVERLERGEADLVFMEWWDGRPGFAATTWRREPLVVIVAVSHPWAAREAVDPEELAGEIVLGGEPGSGTGRVLRAYLGPIADRLQTRSGWGSTEAVKRAVQAGHGISIVMQSSVTDEVASGRLVALPVKGVSLAKEIKLIVAEQLPRESPGARLVSICCNGLEAG